MVLQHANIELISGSGSININNLYTYYIIIIVLKKIINVYLIQIQFIFKIGYFL